jgi:hypothetical protein
MHFHLNYTPQPVENTISHADSLFLIGSCFSEHMAERLKWSGFKVEENPYGILFNPLSIANCLHQIIDKEEPNSMFLKRGELFYSYNCHSSVYGISSDNLNENLKLRREKARLSLATGTHLIITFGSAFVYELSENNHVVANCHKQPSALFHKRLLPVNEIVDIYTNLIHSLKQINSNIKIVFTVSPVKYLKDGIEANALSKATLLLAVHQLVSKQLASYFPAYELVNDDLRDYRFYKEDMAHPNEQAIKYVWEKFCDAFFNENTKALIREMENLNAALNHKVLFPESEEAIAFQQNIEKRKKDLIQRHPYLNFMK